MKKTIEESKITRKNLMDSALTLFLENGFSNITIDQISKNTNLTRGAFYWHFKSKEELLIKILDFNRQKLRFFLEHQFVTVHENNWLKTKSILVSVLENFWLDDEFRNFIKLTWFKLEHQFTESSFAYKTAINEFFINELTTIIKVGQEDGSIKLMQSAETLSLHATTLINGIYRMYFINSQVNDISEAKLMIDMFCDSIKN